MQKEVTGMEARVSRNFSREGREPFQEDLLTICLDQQLLRRFDAYLPRLSSPKDAHLSSAFAAESLRHDDTNAIKFNLTPKRVNTTIFRVVRKFVSKIGFDVQTGLYEKQLRNLPAEVKMLN